jgi:cytidylate kinase
MKSIEKIIEEQMSRWQALSSVRKMEEVPAPVITVSRQPGSGGSLIAQGIAKRLGINVFDREIIQGVAESARMSSYLLETLDEKGLNLLDDWISTLVNERHLWPDQYLQHLMKVVGTIGKHGNAVVVGRGSNFILAQDHVKRVRVVSPLADRVRRVSQTYNVDFEEARRRITRTESNRRAFVRKYFNADIGNPEHYDLVINTGRLSLDAAVETVLAMLPKRF